MNETVESKYKISRIILGICGFLMVGLGTLGIFLPILPTVPLYLVAVFCFSKASKRYEKWLRNTKIFKKRVYFFDKYRVMTLRSMFSILIFVSCILAVTCLLTDKIIVSIVLPAASAAQYLYFILRVKPVSRAEIRKLIAFEAQARS